jgi:glycosyltransferase involved in cell wall biosynthesis
MKILIVTDYFPPEVGAASHLFFELADTLTGRGHQVTVVTGFPRYNAPGADPGYRGRWYLRETVKRFQVVRMRVLSAPGKSLLLRGLEHLVTPFILMAGALARPRHDAVLVYSPPLFFGVAAWAIGRLRSIPFVVNIQDLFPKEAVAIGMMKNRFVIRTFERIERFVYQKADCITVHSPGNRDHVLAHGGLPERTEILHNWVDTEKIRPMPKTNAFRKAHVPDEAFVVSYAGRMGWLQDMPVIVETAALLRDHPAILFLMVGDGPEKEAAIARAQALGLSNMRFLPMQPWEKYPDVLAASDVSMINLNRNLTTPVVPSKLLGIMASGRPVVASVPMDGDAPKIVAEAACGLCVPSGAAQELADAILTLYRDPALAEAMGQRGRRYAEAHFSRESCVTHYEALFQRHIAQRAGRLSAPAPH